MLCSRKYQSGWKAGWYSQIYRPITSKWVVKEERLWLLSNIRPYFRGNIVRPIKLKGRSLVNHCPLCSGVIKTYQNWHKNLRCACFRPLIIILASTRWIVPSLTKEKEIIALNGHKQTNKKNTQADSKTEEWECLTTRMAPSPCSLVPQGPCHPHPSTPRCKMSVIQPQD